MHDEGREVSNDAATGWARFGPWPSLSLKRGMAERSGGRSVRTAAIPRSNRPAAKTGPGRPLSESRMRWKSVTRPHLEARDGARRGATQSAGFPARRGTATRPEWSLGSPFRCSAAGTRRASRRRPAPSPPPTTQRRRTSTAARPVRNSRNSRPRSKTSRAAAGRLSWIAPGQDPADRLAAFARVCVRRAGPVPVAAPARAPDIPPIGESHGLSI